MVFHTSKKAEKMQNFYAMVIFPNLFAAFMLFSYASIVKDYTASVADE
jgi:bacteriorhodopsin